MSLVLSLLAAALAGPVDKVDKFLEKDRYEDAIETAQKWLEKNPYDDEKVLVEAALERAYFAQAKASNTVDAYRAFRQRYPQGDLSTKAYIEEARLAWREIATTSETSVVSNYLEMYPSGPSHKEATSLFANLRFRDAQREDSATVWQAFVDAFPTDPRIREARKKWESTALRDARASEDADALQGFLTQFPESSHRGAVIHEVISRTAVLEIPCRGKPPRCGALDLGTPISATWTPVEGVALEAKLVAWSEAEGGTDLKEALSNWAGPSYAAEAVMVAGQLLGTSTDHSWHLTLPVSLRRPQMAGVEGYAVRISAPDVAPVDLPFSMSEVWPSPPAQPSKLLIRDGSTVSIWQPGAPSTPLADLKDIPLDDDSRIVLGWDHLTAWSEKGLAKIDLQTGSVDRIVERQSVSGAWLAGNTVFYLMKKGDQSELHAVSGSGERTQVLPAEQTTPPQFWPIATATDRPVVLLSTEDGFWVASTTAAPREVAQANPKDYTVVMEPSGRRAAFLKTTGTTTAIRIANLQQSGSFASSIDVTAVLGGGPHDFIFWGKVTWSGDQLIGEVFSGEGRIGTVAIAIEHDTLTPRAASGSELAEANARHGALAFSDTFLLEKRTENGHTEYWRQKGDFWRQVTYTGDIRVPTDAGCTPADDLDLVRIHEHWLAVRAIRQTCGPDRKGPLLIVSTDGANTFQVLSDGAGLPSWVLDNWSPEGTSLLFPDGQLFSAEGTLLQKVDKGEKAFWYRRPLRAYLN